MLQIKNNKNIKFKIKSRNGRTQNPDVNVFFAFTTCQKKVGKQMLKKVQKRKKNQLNGEVFFAGHPTLEFLDKNSFFLQMEITNYYWTLTKLNILQLNYLNLFTVIHTFYIGLTAYLTIKVIPQNFLNEKQTIFRVTLLHIFVEIFLIETLDGKDRKKKERSSTGKIRKQFDLCLFMAWLLKENTTSTYHPHSTKNWLE